MILDLSQEDHAVRMRVVQTPHWIEWHILRACAVLLAFRGALLACSRGAGRRWVCGSADTDYHHHHHPTHHHPRPALVEIHAARFYGRDASGSVNERGWRDARRCPRCWNSEYNRNHVDFIRETTALSMCDATDFRRIDREREIKR